MPMRISFERKHVEKIPIFYKKLQDEISTPICLDESIHNPNDAKLSIEHGACKIINIKPGRVGGYSNAIKMTEKIHRSYSVVRKTFDNKLMLSKMF